MLERFLGQTWVMIAAFLIGPAILYMIYRRRKRPGEPAARPDRTASPRPAEPQRAASSAAAPPPPETGGARRPLWPGFRGLNWGQPPLEEMKVVHEEGEASFYARPSDDLRLGSIQVSSVTYSFRLGRLDAVIIELPMSGFEPMNRHLAAEWGTARSSADRSRHVWSDPGAGAEASQAVLEKRAESRTARLVLSSRAALAERSRSQPGG